MEKHLIHLHALSTWPKKMNHDFCYVIPHEGEQADEFLVRCILRQRILTEGYGNDALFETPPDAVMFYSEIYRVEIPNAGRAHEAMRQSLNTMLPWQGITVQGKNAQPFATTAGTIAALSDSGKGVVHVR